MKLALRYVFGQIMLNYQVFFGEVEEINKSLENQQTFLRFKEETHYQS